MSEGVAEVKELARRGDYSHEWVACLQQEVSIPVLQLYSPIITFTIQRQLRAHAQEVSGDHVTSAVCVPSTTPTVTPPPTSARPLYSTCHPQTCSCKQSAPEKLSHSVHNSVKKCFFSVTTAWSLEMLTFIVKLHHSLEALTIFSQVLRLPSQRCFVLQKTLFDTWR